MSADFLAAMAASSHERVTQARARRPEAEVRARAAGQLKQTDEDIGARVTEYAQAGAAAISVLTEPSRFDGSMAHLQRAGEALKGLVPVMRKDFLVDAYQVWEARVAGAGGVLIILRMLERARLRSLIEAAAQLGLFALLEAFD